MTEGGIKKSGGWREEGETEEGPYCSVVCASFLQMFAPASLLPTAAIAAETLRCPVRPITKPTKTNNFHFGFLHATCPLAVSAPFFSA